MNATKTRLVTDREAEGLRRRLEDTGPAEGMVMGLPKWPAKRLLATCRELEEVVEDFVSPFTIPNVKRAYSLLAELHERPCP